MDCKRAQTKLFVILRFSLRSNRPLAAAMAPRQKTKQQRPNDEWSMSDHAEYKSLLASLKNEKQPTAPTGNAPRAKAKGKAAAKPPGKLKRDPKAKAATAKADEPPRKTARAREAKCDVREANEAPPSVESDDDGGASEAPASPAPSAAPASSHAQTGGKGAAAAVPESKVNLGIFWPKKLYETIEGKPLEKTNQQNHQVQLGIFRDEKYGKPPGSIEVSASTAQLVQRVT